MAETRELEYYDVDGDEFDIDIDNSPANFQNGWYAVKITRAPITQAVYEGSDKKYLTARVAFSIVDDESLEGVGASCFIPLKGSNSITAAQKRQAFLNAVTGSDVPDHVQLKGEVVTNKEGTRIPQLADVVDERIGAFLVLEKNNGRTFVNVKDDMFCAYADLETKRMEMEGFDDF